MTILIIVLIIIAIPFVLAMFSGSEYTIESGIVINKPQQEVFDYIKLLKNQDHYSKWVMTDPAMKKTFTGTDGTVGFIYAWDSQNKQAGQGEQEITTITDGTGLDTEVRFIRPFSGKAFNRVETEALASGQTNTKWIFRGNKNYLMKVMHLLLNLEKVLKKDIDTSLNNLKNILEQQ